MIRVVIFDFGGVLMRTKDPVGRREWEARLNLRPGELEQVIHNSDLWMAAQRGWLSPESYWSAIAGRLGMPESDIPALRTDYFRNDHLDQPLITLIRDLKKRGYKVGLLSNDASTLERKLRDDLGIYDEFDSVIISANIGVMKPDPVAFRTAADSLGFSVAECVFIDDNTANVDGALAVGMAAVLFRPEMDLDAALKAAIEPRSAPTTTIIFDWGNVLDIALDMPAWFAYRESLGAVHNMTGEQYRDLIFASDAWAQVKTGQIGFREYLEAIFHPLGYADYESQHAAYLRYMKDRIHIHPEMIEIVMALKTRYRIALLSNAWQLDMETWLKETDSRLNGLFEVVVSSAAVGMAKPDPEIYRLTLEKLNVSASEALFIDDLIRNTTTAEAIGLPCIVFESPAQLRAALRHRGLLE